MTSLTHIFVDLDGPLLDGRRRHYFCYQTILRKFACTPLEIDQYWNQKRTGGDRHTLLKLSGAEGIYAAYLGLWLSLIESPEALAFDSVQEGAIARLTDWKKAGYSLNVVTMRKNGQALGHQLETLGLRPLLDSVVLCKHEDGGEGKAHAAKRLFPSLDFAGSALWIGDTEVDSDAAAALNCRLILASNGLRDEVFLRSRCNTMVVPSIAGLKL